MSGLSAVEAESLLYTLLLLFGSEFSNFDDVYVHGVRVIGLGGGGEGMVGLMGRFRVSFGDLFSAFPLGLEGNSLLVPVVDGGGDCVHRHNSVHEGGRDSSGEISDKDILISDACEH